jgi:5'-deoxynucleotidase YfbR-like HD superfamily hydrolase
LTFDINKSYLEYLGRKGEDIKLDVERSAWDYIIKRIEPASVQKCYSPLESEFNAEKTVESQIVHAADRLDILFQIVSYHRKGYPKSMLADLWASTDRKLSQTKLSSVRRLHKTALQLYRATLSEL